jgi:hypothetical protein
MRRTLIAFLVLGFFFGFAATKTKKDKVTPLTKKQIEQKEIDNFDFLYGQWELLSTQGIKSRQPSSLEDKSINFVLEEDIYLESNATKANSTCEAGVEFKKFGKGDHKAFIKLAKS